MDIANLQELLVDEMRDIYNAENQILKALPKMAKKATNPKLKQAFESHLQETEGHVERLRKVFEGLGQKPTGKKCAAMQGIIEEGSELMSEDMSDEAMDAALIAAAQKVEHYEIASYGTVRAWANVAGMKDVAKVLQQTLNEEGAADEKLTKIAESSINVQAADAAHA
jgi:ferritin-like metal-binding protein YciE